MNNKVMPVKAAKALVIFSALFLILLGVGLNKLFEYQGYDKKETNKFINYNVKDYGTLIPGHGGIMDRFDSVIFTAPVVYWAIILLNSIGL